MNLQKNDIKRYIIRRYSIDELTSIDLQENIRRILREEISNQTIYTNNNVTIGDIYDESDIYTYIQKLHHKRSEDFWEGDLGDRIEKYPYYIVKEIPISDIELDEFYVDEDDVEEYVDMFIKRQSYPPIVIGKKHMGYHSIIDGTHRANALKELGFNSIICFVGTKKIIKEETRFQKMGEDKYKSCSMSDITRMEIIDDFFNRVSNNPNYNIDEPDYDMLLDDWDGYDDQVYIQNKLENDTIIFYEGWVDSCWSAVYNKPQYKGMSKKQVIKDIITNRFPRISEEFNMSIDDYGYINDDGYIMYVVMKK